jgi:hypothetical protein
MEAVAVASPLAAVPAQQSHPLSQTEAVDPPALTPPLTPPLMCPKLAPVSFLGSAACLLPQARRLQIRWVLSDCWPQLSQREPPRRVCPPLPCQQSTEQR